MLSDPLKGKQVPGLGQAYTIEIEIMASFNQKHSEHMDL